MAISTKPGEPTFVSLGIDKMGIIHGATDDGKIAFVTFRQLGQEESDELGAKGDCDRYVQGARAGDVVIGFVSMDAIDLVRRSLDKMERDWRDAIAKRGLN